MEQSTQFMLSAAIQAARNAGKIINRACLNLEHQSGANIYRKDAYDFATQTDKAAEEAILSHLMENFPNHGFLSEECGYVLGPAVKEGDVPEYQWIIDPLDGTKNFANGLEIFAVSIALAHKGEVIRAVIYDPSRNELFSATKGKGAFLDNRRIRVSNCQSLSEALIAGRFTSVRADHSQDQRFYQLIDHTMGIRHLGSTALELAYVACGRLDGCCCVGLKLWDLAAGSLIIQEAGGLLGDLDAEAGWSKSGDLVAAGDKVFGEMIRYLDQGQ